MRKPLTIVFLCAALSFSPFAQEAGNGAETAAVVDFSELDDILSSLIESSEYFLQGIDAAQDEYAIADALRSYAGDIADLRERMTALDPSVRESVDPSNLPDSIKASMAQLGELSARMESAMNKIQEYSESDEVQSAMEDLQKLTS